MERRPRTWNIPLVATAVVAAVWVSMTLAVFGYVQRSIDARSALIFSSEADDASEAIARRLTTYVEALYAGRALVAGSEVLTRKEFNRFVGHLDVPNRYPGIQVLGRAELVSKATIDGFITSVEDDAASSGLAYPSFEPYPATGYDDRVVIDYIEPQNGNERAFGLDLLSEPNRRSAVERARDTGDYAATAPITLVDESAGQRAFLVMLAGYDSPEVPETVEERRAAFTAVEYAAFRMGDLMKGVFTQEPSFTLEIYDLGVAADGALDPTIESQMYSLSGTRYAVDGAPVGDNVLIELEFGGRKWGLFFTSTASSLTPFEQRLPLLVALMGVLLGGLAARTTWRLVTSREQAIALAGSKQRDLRLSKGELAALEERFQAAFHRSPVAMAITDRSGMILDRNASFDTLPGAETATTLQGFVSDADAVLDLSLAGRHASHRERRLGEVGGVERWVVIQASSMDSAGTTGGQVLVQFVDITDRKYAIEAMEAALEHERDAVIQLEELEQVRSDFVATVSHELRTPLSSLEGSIEMLQDGGLDQIGVDPDDLFAMMQRAIRRLESTVENLLHFGKLDDHTFDIEADAAATPVAVATLISEAVAMVTPAAEGNEVALVWRDSTRDLWTAGSQRQLERVIVNLLSNAIKYTLPGGTVEVTSEQTDDRVRITVSDNGRGISLADQDRLFTRYFRSSDPDIRNIQGTGLGLFIVKRIVENHAGEVSVSSTLGQGTTFHVDLALSPVPAHSG